MAIRDLLLTRIAREILGPRDGPYERMTSAQGPPPDPADEYITGVLEPQGYDYGPLAFFDRPSLASGNPDVGMMDTPEVAPHEDDDSGYSQGPVEISPILDPRALPKSMGLSFVVAADSNPVISFCATWARYSRDKNAWVRKPFYHIEHNVDPSKEASWRSSQDPNVVIYLKSFSDTGKIHVSLYLVNETSVSGERKPRTPELIFQPQIRVVCQEKTRLLPVQGNDDEELDILYRKRHAKARGHLCSAVWDEIDPQLMHDASKSLLPEEDGPPFTWVDSVVVPEPDRTVFSKCNVRTDYLPCYGVEQSSLSGPAVYRLEEFESQRLSETWDPAILRGILMPMIDAYADWIEQQKATMPSLESRFHNQARRNLKNCADTLERMSEGLHLLLTNNDARLAFCFMNKVMYQQSIWKDPSRPLKWRLFQMAFILQCIPGIIREDHPDRKICDLLWFATGAGKTEAYLGIAAFTIGLRRLKAKSGNGTEAGTVVLSRYTLRLLTIQQFRRTLSMITAAEYLRTTGWLPKGYGKKNNPWGTSRFSIGLWVGTGVTPNGLLDRDGFDRFRRKPVKYLGAIGELTGRRRLGIPLSRIKTDESEPAQVLTCPSCKKMLAVTSTSLYPGPPHTIHWVISCKKKPNTPSPSAIPTFRGISLVRIHPPQALPNGHTYVITAEFSVSSHLTDAPNLVDDWWDRVIKPAVDPTCIEEFARPSRPGYFFIRDGFPPRPVDFEIRCPNPNCDLNKVQWSEHVPVKEGNVKLAVHPAFEIPQKKGYSQGMPIPAYPVDEQIYSRCPSMIISTVDKFARLSFEPRSAAIFGHVNRYHSVWGYYRDSALPDRDLRTGTSYDIDPLDPPELIIQDELHLLEGPLGTMAGLYESAIEILASKHTGSTVVFPKYVASTATIRNAGSQVAALFMRSLSQFPPSGLSLDDNFFAISREPHALESSRPGRLYVGISCPGRGAQTPIVRIWSIILHTTFQIRQLRGDADKEADFFRTLVGYFNAIRELAGASGLLRQDIPSRLAILASRTGTQTRRLPAQIDLSSRSKSHEIPGILDRLSRFPGNDVDAVFATSMFGTGVDVDRLGLMMVHGQPKTTANYIQATGRVGRQGGGLVLTFLRSSRPRDLDHYEFFTGYHRALYRHVEPITVYPYSPRARERGLGPMSVAIIRNARHIYGVSIPPEWASDGIPSSSPTRSSVNNRRAARRIGCLTIATRLNSPEVQAMVDFISDRGGRQPEGRNPGASNVRTELESELQRWWTFASQDFGPRWHELIYWENVMNHEPEHAVVLGDPEHEEKTTPQVYRNAPNSLREVEATTTFDDEV